MLCSQGGVCHQSLQSDSALLMVPVAPWGGEVTAPSPVTSTVSRPWLLVEVACMTLPWAENTETKSGYPKYALPEIQGWAGARGTWVTLPYKPTHSPVYTLTHILSHSSSAGFLSWLFHGLAARLVHGWKQVDRVSSYSAAILKSLLKLFFFIMGNVRSKVNLTQQEIKHLTLFLSDLYILKTSMWAQVFAVLLGLITWHSSEGSKTFLCF